MGQFRLTRERSTVTGQGEPIPVMGVASVTPFAVGATSAQVATFTDTDVITISCDVDAYLILGTNPTAASTTSVFLAAGMRVDYRVEAGTKLAVIAKATTGRGTIEFRS